MSIRTFTCKIFVSIFFFLGFSSCDMNYYPLLSLPKEVNLSGEEQQISLKAKNTILDIKVIEEGHEPIKIYDTSLESVEGDWYKVSAIRNRKELDVYVKENNTGEPRSIKVRIGRMADAVSTTITQQPL